MEIDFRYMSQSSASSIVIHDTMPYRDMVNSSSAITGTPKKLVRTVFPDAAFFNAVLAVAEAEVEAVPPI